MKLLHLVGFIIKKFVTMQHGHMNVKLNSVSSMVVAMLRKEALLKENLSNFVRTGYVA